MEILQQLDVDKFMTADEQSQAPYAAMAFGTIILCQVLLNALEVKAPGHSQFVEKGVHYFALFAILFLNLVLDTSYPDISFAWWAVKGFIGAYGIGVIDFYFSEITNVPISETMVGLSIWVGTYMLANGAVSHWFGNDNFVVNTTNDLYDYTFFPSSYARMFLKMALGGFFSDMLFNPLHRLQHHRHGYQHDHKHHHQYTDKLCGLAFFTGTFTDHVIMSCSVALGFMAEMYMFHCLGFLHGYMSSGMYHFAWGLATYAHSHNENLSTMILPIPEEQNFITYHRMHHIDPKCNMGFTKAGDQFFDWLFGQETCRKCNSKTE
eukprot:TRINITY_DN1720_c3_g1_i1.p1 TRINITY_DN1720_c3_g1~~TRINITY_DN1720_c3_g1_i1.p1  ORF type:complete len:321 (+),score=42.07 TRINITY_DN1720_c3_g1_i1:52-1014(+)